MGQRLLGVDVGQSGVRAVAGGGQVRSRQRGMHAVLDHEAVKELASLVGDLVYNETPVDVCAVSLTGFVDDLDLLSLLSEQLQRAVRAARLVIASDIAAAYIGSLGRRRGVAVIWGTGSVALAADGQGSWQRVDGRGHALGDYGSGYWIGQRGLSAALDWEDGRGGSVLLARRAAKLGTPAEIYQQAYSARSTTQFVAAFATAVVDAASEGDPVATDILEDAARELATTVHSAARILPTDAPATIGLTGGLSRVDGLVGRLRRHLWPSAAETELVVVPDAPLRGALRLAAEPLLGHWFPGLVHAPNGTA